MKDREKRRKRATADSEPSYERVEGELWNDLEVSGSASPKRAMDFLDISTLSVVARTSQQRCQCTHLFLIKLKRIFMPCIPVRLLELAGALPNSA